MPCMREKTYDMTSVPRSDTSVRPFMHRTTKYFSRNLPLFLQFYRQSLSFEPAAVAQTHGDELDVQELVDAVLALFSSQAALHGHQWSVGRCRKHNAAITVSMLLHAGGLILGAPMSHVLPWCKGSCTAPLNSMTWVNADIRTQCGNSQTAFRA